VKRFYSQAGITLLEIMLALAVASSILVLSIKMNQSWVFEQNVAQLRFSVEQLFLGMGNYYRANCGIQGQGGSTTPTYGTLVTTTTPFAVSIGSLTSFLPPAWMTTYSNNPLVDVSGGAVSAYILQFNLVTASVNTNCSAKDCVTNTTVAIPNPMNALIWRAQVAVKIKNTALANDLAARLAAYCNSSLATSTTVTPCEASPTAGGYLVWERLPSFASPDLTSSLWVSMPALKEFNLQYTHDQMFEMSQSTYLNDTVTGVSLEYYLCGG
jgi:hypothetical protein